jgi:hypothetical protein
LPVTDELEVEVNKLNQTQLNLEVKDSLFDPNQRSSQAKVRVRNKDGKKYCQVFIYLEGSDLPYVEQVSYVLHKDSVPPVQTVVRTLSNPNCALAFWTFGAFVAKATIVDKKGFSYLASHPLSYEKQLPTEPDKYDYEEGEPETNARPTLVTA